MTIVLADLRPEPKPKHPPEKAKRAQGRQVTLGGGDDDGPTVQGDGADKKTAPPPTEGTKRNGKRDAEAVWPEAVS